MNEGAKEGLSMLLEDGQEEFLSLASAPCFSVVKHSVQPAHSPITDILPEMSK